MTEQEHLVELLRSIGALHEVDSQTVWIGEQAVGMVFNHQGALLGVRQPSGGRGKYQMAFVPRVDCLDEPPPCQGCQDKS